MNGVFASGFVEPAQDGRYAWFRLGASMLLGIIGSIGMWSYIVVLPAVQAEFGVDRADASFPYTATMIGFAIGNLAIGRFVDRHGVALPVAAAALLLAAGYVLCALFENFLAFAVVQGAFIGIGTAAGFGPLIADITHWFKRRRGVAVACVASGNYLAGALWSPMIETVTEAEGWRFAYLAIAALVVCVMVPAAFLLRPRAILAPPGAPGGPTLSGGDLSIDLSPRALQILLVAAGLGCCVAMSMPQVHIVAYCVDLGYGASSGTQMLSLMLAGGVASRLFSGVLMDKIGGVRTLLLGSVLQCLALFLYLPFDGLASLYLVSLIFGLSQGGIVPSYAIIVREYMPAREAGARTGMVLMATIIGMALGGWLSGWIFDLTGSYSAAFVNGIAWNLINILIMVLLLLRTGRPRLAPA
ncbi:MAG: MFS transporter [Alphaproteobacteria bacterium]|nr:MFS transporter [Alphaproteobacteria bacterium]